MDSKVNYTAVGLFVIILTATFIGIIIWLSADHHKHYNRYLVFMKESVSGLLVNGPVRFNGVDVGSVEEIGIDSHDSQEVRILIRVQDTTPITKSTVATLMAQGLTGITYIGLKSKTSSAPPLLKTPGEPYPVIPTEPSVLVQLNDALRDITNSIKNMGDSFMSVFSDKNLTSIQNFLDKISTASNQLPDAMTKIRGAAQSFTCASDAATITLEESRTIIRNINHFTLPEINRAAGTLNSTLDNLKSITGQMRQNPAVIVRGTKRPPPGPGE